MLRRQITFNNNTLALRRAVTLSKTSSASSAAVVAVATATSSLRFNNSASKESEAEREARMRQEMMNKMMSGRNPFAGMFKQGMAGAGSPNSPPSSSAFDTSNYNHWANTPFHRSLRFWCSVLIFVTGVYMMRRMGMMGDYTHLTLPFYAASPADQTKWILFIFNIEDARRRQLVKQWETQKLQTPNANFFDFVDSQEQNWRSSPNFSGDQVIAAVAGAMRTQGPPRAITSIKATLNTTNFFTSTIFGGTGNPVEERAKRIDGMMMNLGTALNPLSALMSGSSSSGTPAIFSSGPGGLQAIQTGYVSPQQQMYAGGMNIQQLQQLQQQGGGNYYTNIGAPSPYTGGGQQQFYGNTQQQQQHGSNPFANQQQQLAWGNNNQQQNFSNTNNNSILSSVPSTVVDGEKHACEVKFLNDQQQPPLQGGAGSNLIPISSMTNSTTSSEERKQ